ncbi:hypothetical protein [Ideonella sp. YS5]|uniref:hypothetical protein n=1 Tax=Ideonella sp. YS5 TaxID=3453714 RepID=UPI003EEB9732
MGGVISKALAGSPVQTASASSPELAHPGAAAPSPPDHSTASPRGAGVLDGLAQRRSPSQDEAATTLQAHWRGAHQRDVNARDAQGHTPYRSELHYQMASHGYCVEAQPMKRFSDGTTGPREKEWVVYESTRHVPKGSLALLHSRQQEQEKDEMKQALYQGQVPKGVVYDPGDEHDMRVNSAWMLGLAHHRVPTVMASALDDVTVVRKSAREEAPEEQNTDSNLSALAREVMAMTGSGHFRLGGALLGKQVLVPTPSASNATLADFKTPSGMPQEEVKRKLDQAGIDTAGLS